MNRSIQYNLFGEPVYNAICKWCGKKFVKPHNRSEYCSEDCALNKRRENKARYQAKRRLLAKRKLLILPEHQKYGLGSYGTSATGHMKSTFDEESRSIKKEMRRIGFSAF